MKLNPIWGNLHSLANRRNSEILTSVSCQGVISAHRAHSARNDKTGMGARLIPIGSPIVLEHFFELWRLFFGQTLRQCLPCKWHMRTMSFNGDCTPIASSCSGKLSCCSSAFLNSSTYGTTCLFMKTFIRGRVKFRAITGVGVGVRVKVRVRPSRGSGFDSSCTE